MAVIISYGSQFVLQCPLAIMSYGGQFSLKQPVCLTAPLLHHVCLLPPSLYFDGQYALWWGVCLMAACLPYVGQYVLWRPVCLMAACLPYTAQFVFRRPVCLLAACLPYGGLFALWRPVCLIAASVRYFSQFVLPRSVCLKVHGKFVLWQPVCLTVARRTYMAACLSNEGQLCIMVFHSWHINWKPKIIFFKRQLFCWSLNMAALQPGVKQTMPFSGFIQIFSVSPQWPHYLPCWILPIEQNYRAIPHYCLPGD